LADGFLWYNVYNKFCKNWSSDSKAAREDMQVHWAQQPMMAQNITT
jgi:hypothetical protein